MCYEAWRFVSHREEKEGGEGLHSAATNSEEEGTMSLTDQHACTSTIVLKEHIVCAFPLSCVVKPLLPAF